MPAGEAGDATGHHARAGLEAAYRATEYRIGGAVARIGRRSAAVDAMLARWGVRQAAVLTAWNPRSARMPPGWNERMQRALLARLRRIGWVEASGTARGWSERHIAAPLPAARAAVLGRLFRQNAIVLLARRRPARLLWLPGQRRV